MTEPVTMDLVRAQLDPEEPDYAQAAQLGQEAIPYLLELVEGNDPMLASKAAYLASVIGGDGAIDVLRVASRSPEDTVRVAAGAGLRNLEVPAPLVERLLTDEDVGVRSTTLRSVVKNPSSRVRADVERVAASDPDPALRDLAEQVLTQLP
jgi:HEAT repeat protein